MTPQQIKWASEHDWFIGNLTEGVMVEERLVDGAGVVKTSLKIFNNFQKLRDWAGY